MSDRDWLQDLQQRARDEMHRLAIADAAELARRSHESYLRQQVDWVEVTTFGSSSIERVPIEVRSPEQQPIDVQPNPCQNCCNYHGQSYNGTALVCGMHPYGWKGDKCPDWEAQSQSTIEAIEARTNPDTIEMTHLILAVLCQERSIAHLSVSIWFRVGLDVTFSQGQFCEERRFAIAELETARRNNCLGDHLAEAVRFAVKGLDRQEQNSRIEFHPRNNNRRLWDW